MSVMEAPVLLVTETLMVTSVPIKVTEFWTVSVEMYCQILSMATLLPVRYVQFPVFVFVILISLNVVKVFTLACTVKFSPPPFAIVPLQFKDKGIVAKFMKFGIPVDNKSWSYL